MGDPAALDQCLQNLLSNAIKHGGGNRWVAVRARAVPTGDRAEVQISIEDKGAGIAASDLPHIFEPFYRGKAAKDDQIRGVGLGLHLVKRMVEAMGGSVTVSSRPGQGSLFTLHLPTPEEDAPAHG